MPRILCNNPIMLPIPPLICGPDKSYRMQFTAVSTIGAKSSPCVILYVLYTQITPAFGASNLLHFYDTNKSNYIVKKIFHFLDNES